MIAIGAGGIRTPAGRVKSSLCCRYTTTPSEGVATFVCQIEFHDALLQSLGTELNRRSRRIRTMCFRYTTKRSRDGRTRTDDSVVPGHVGCRSPTSRLSVRTVGFEPTISWPPARRDTRLRYALPSSNDPCGIRTQPGQLERLATSPEVERAVCVWTYLLCVPANRIFWRWAGRRSNPSLLVFSQALNRLSYQPICVRCTRSAQRKSPVSFA